VADLVLGRELGRLVQTRFRQPVCQRWSSALSRWRPWWSQLAWRSSVTGCSSVGPAVIGIGAL